MCSPASVYSCSFMSSTERNPDIRECDLKILKRLNVPRCQPAYSRGMADTLSHAERCTFSGQARGSVVQIIDEQVARGDRTLTPLGKKLLEARRRIEQSCIPLLSDEELDREKAERRGGVED